MNRNRIAGLSTLLITAVLSTPSHAQAPLKEDFTGTTTTNSWYFFNGACLTASTTVPVAAPGPGSPPGCTKSGYYSENLVGGASGAAGTTQTLPDSAGSGALRFTNGSTLLSSGSYSGGFNQNGAIISAAPYAVGTGLNITFKTVSYRGNAGGNGGSGNSSITGPGKGLPISANDGADGMSFFLMNGTATPNIGAYGGSLGYTCSNSNPPYNGMVGAFLGLGIDEYGNFLNPGDNTVSGPGLQANRIGLRGAGGISWTALNTAYPSQYPSGLTSISVTLPNGSTGTAAQYAVHDTCATGFVWDYSKVTSTATLPLKTQTTTAVQDYAYIPNGYTVLSGVTIADEYASGGYARNSTGVTPIQYQLKITQSGLLSLQTSINGGAYTYVLQNQSIASASGTVPSTLLFGFAGSSGGSTNIHEILCFQAAPSTDSGSSAAVNQKQSAPINSTSQAFFAFYNPSNWTGRVTANTLVSGTNSSGQPTLTITTTPNWDASCTLTGATSTQCATGSAATAEAPNTPGVIGNREIFTYNGTGSPLVKGVAFQYTNLSSAQQTALTLGDSTSTSCYPNCRLNYLRGDRSQEITTSGSGLFRARTDILGDIIDSSPVWVGPPSASFTHTWVDQLFPTATMPENTSGVSSYPAYISAQQLRQNVVYVGSNDGMLHGFRAGGTDVNNNLINNTTTPNDGVEVLAYVPGAVLQSAASSSTSTNCVSTNATQSVVQNIHGVTPAIGSAVACTQSAIDFSNPQYGHNYFVDATPGTGDLYYGGGWHSWLVGGLGAGGAGIYALDVTNPSNFLEANAASLVVGEWTSGTITCSGTATGNSTCANSMGNSYGTPLIRRLHNGQWGIIFGNGLGSSSGDAGIFVGVISTGTTPGITYYYLTTGTSGNNGIAYVAAADLDGDHVTDYVYAGDLLGNVWRFDLTSNNANTWAVSSYCKSVTTPCSKAAPLFTATSATGGVQPITTQLVVGGGAPANGPLQVMIAFGTGQRTPLTNSSAIGYLGGAQTLYGIWDYNMTPWNANSTVQFANLTTAAVAASTCVGSTTLGRSQLQAQTVVIDAAANNNREIPTSSSILWATTSGGCTTSSKYGWLIDLPGPATSQGSEQIVFNPEILGNSFVVNSIIPAGNTVLTCTPQLDTGFTYAINFLTGAPGGNFQNFNSDTIGLNTGGTGTPYFVFPSESGAQGFLIQPTENGPGTPVPFNKNANILGNRLTWKELR